MVSRSTRSLVRQRAQSLCEYCHSPEYLSPDRFTVDHILPQSLNGSDDPENLALACYRCNLRRSNTVEAIDPETGEKVPLFNPRRQGWNDNFIWTADGLRMIGTTVVGRATCERLDFNDDRHDDGAILHSRGYWTQGGWHPPMDDAVEASG